VETERRAARERHRRPGLQAPGAKRLVAHVAVAPDLERAAGSDRDAEAADHAGATTDLVVVVAQSRKRRASGGGEAHSADGERALGHLAGGSAVVVDPSARGERRAASLREREAEPG